MSDLRRPARVDLVVDTSAVMAIVLGESGAEEVVAALRAASGPVISSGTAIELAIVAASRLGDRGPEAVQTLLDAARVVAVPVDRSITALAHDGWRRFGKGRHAAALNYGDCFAYATAKHYEAALLCVGDDFARTDVGVVPVRKARRRR